MIKYFLLIILLTLITVNTFAGDRASEATIDLSRNLSRELFDSNGVQYLKPMVVAVNATSNSRFFNSAYIPHKVSKPYFRFGLHAMYGFVNASDREFAPTLPAEQFQDTSLLRYINLTNFSIDTAGLTQYLFKTILYDGVRTNRPDDPSRKMIEVPKKASTVLGGYETNFLLYRDFMQTLVKRRLEIIKANPLYKVLYPQLSSALDSLYTKSIEPVLNQFPEKMTLPKGGNLNSIFAFVPQFEIGSLWGTELLLRGIPPLNLGKYIGDFAFWGVGLKHSISQYFYLDDDTYNGDAGKETESTPFNLAVQVAYQGTDLTNKIGETNSEMDVNGTFFDFNIHSGYRWDKVFDVPWDGPMDIYIGYSYETLDITSNYTYWLPVESQYRLGMMEDPTNPDPNHPTSYYKPDYKPQTTTIDMKDNNNKFVIGFCKQFGRFAIFADYSISKFNIFTGGLQLRF
ncbi:MAG: hypothetical protein HW421_274 [Ignavibacteria bacterium]|nr:hypothetical protein [Ignavibacteria bacterium]